MRSSYRMKESGRRIKHVDTLGLSFNVIQRKCHRSNPHMITHYLASVAYAIWCTSIAGLKGSVHAMLSLAQSRFAERTMRKIGFVSDLKFIRGKSVLPLLVAQTR